MKNGEKARMKSIYVRRKGGGRGETRRDVERTRGESTEEIATERADKRENFCTREAPPYTAATRASKYKGARRSVAPLCPSTHAFRRGSLLFATRGVATLSRRDRR